MFNKRLCQVLVGLVLFLSACNRDSGFLYYVAQKATPERFSFSHRVKEIQGESRVDIVWIIDNSGSMGVYQQAVRDNARLFIQQFTKTGGLDWRMALLSTDESDLPYVGMLPGKELSKYSADPVDLFQRAVGSLGIAGSAIEKTFTPLLKSLSAFPSFLRTDAILAVIAVTDAAEQSTHLSKDFLSSITTLKGSLNKFIMYGVFAAKDFGCTSDEGAWDYAKSPYEDIIAPTKGKTYPLCSANFGANLADLGNDLVTRVRRPRLRLAKRPDPQTIQLTFKGQDLPGGLKEAGGYWIYDFELNSLVFHDLDFAKDEIEEVLVSFVEAI